MKHISLIFRYEENENYEGKKHALNCYITHCPTCTCLAETLYITYHLHFSNGRILLVVFAVKCFILCHIFYNK